MMTMMKMAMSHKVHRPSSSHCPSPLAGSCHRHIYPGGSKIIFIFQVRLREGQEMNASPNWSPVQMTLHSDVTDSGTELAPP